MCIGLVYAIIVFKFTGMNIMHISIDNIKTTAFILKYKSKGYRLLKNPKGVSPNDVSMIKTWFGFHPDYYDKHYHYQKIHRYKDRDKFIKDETLLVSEYIMDPETKTYSGKRKNLDGYTVKKGKLTEFVKRPYAQDELYRPLPEWNDGNEEYDFGENLFLENREGRYYLPRPSIFKRLICFGLESYRKLCGYSELKPFEPSFWSVLKANLNNSIAK